MNDLIILAGPTAVGKSSLSIELAKKIGAGIISADSMQVYKHMDIGTAKLKKEEMQGIPHYLIDDLEPTEDFNIVWFQKKAKEAIEEITADGLIPMIVGGTGFYIQSVVYDIDFSQNDDTPEFRKEIEHLIEEKGAVYVHDMLKEKDPEAALAINPNDHRRLIRALEYHMQTGKRISDHNNESRQRTSPYNFCYFVLNDDRSKIYKRIDDRVDKMMEEGLLDEVKGLMNMGLSRQNVSMHGIGYKELIDHLSGECSLEEAVYRIKRESRHFAKRQLTWFKREKDVCWLNRDIDNDIMGEIMARLKMKGIING